MRRLITTLALSASLALAACTPPKSAGDVAAAVDHAAADYASAKAVAEIMLPFLPADRAAQVREWIARGDAAIVATKAATSLAEQLAQQRKAADAAAALDKVSSRSTTRASYERLLGLE